MSGRNDEERGVDLHAGQTIDDIHTRGLALLDLDVEIDVVENRTTSVDAICSEDVFPRGHGKQSKTAGIRQERITSPNQDDWNTWDSLLFPVYICYDQSRVDERCFCPLIGTSEESEGEEEYGELTDHGGIYGKTKQKK